MSDKSSVSDRTTHSPQADLQTMRPNQVFDGPSPQTRQADRRCDRWRDAALGTNFNSENLARKEELESWLKKHIASNNETIDHYKAFLWGMILRKTDNHEMNNLANIC
jgi:hypothetical protein